MFYIVTSNEEYTEAADLIVRKCDQFSISASIVDINVLGDVSFGNKDILFFLTNDYRVGNLASVLSLKGVGVLNGAYLVGNREKSFAQRQARNAGVTVPRFVANLDFRRMKAEKVIKGLDYPLYIKSEGHVQGAFRTADASELNCIITGLDPEAAWYFEEAVDKPGRHLEKLYWVAGTSFERDGSDAPREDIRIALNAIGKKLSFDAFSADFIVGENSYFCVDINPASGLFGTKAGREAFVDLIKDVTCPGSASFMKMLHPARRPHRVFS